MPAPLRLVFAGTPEFAAPHLRACLAENVEIAAVYTQPDRPAGRGRTLAASPVKQAALAAGLVVEQPESLKSPDAKARLRELNPDLLVVVAYGLILPRAVLAVPRLGCWNVHASLLPRWRGAAPIERALMAGDEATGVSVMRVGAGLDSGPVALAEEVAIGAEEDFESLSAKLAGLGGELVVEALDRLAAGSLDFAEQDDERATYAEKIGAEDRRLDPARPAAELARTVRALTPHVGAYLETAAGERLGVRRARPVDVRVKRGEAKAEWGALLLGCGRGALRLEVVQPPGGKPMAADAFLRGHPLPKFRP